MATGIAPPIVELHNMLWCWHLHRLGVDTALALGVDSFVDGRLI